VTQYIVRRLLASAVVVWGVVTLTFFLVRVLPGDPAALSLGVSADAETLARLRHAMGLDRPLTVQYAIFLRDAARGDFGQSVYMAQPSTRLFLTKLPATIELAVAAMIVSVLVAFPLGIYAALRANSLRDNLVSVFTLTAQCMPNFWVGIMLILIFSQGLRLLPTFGRGTWQQLVLPVIAVALPLMALTARLVRTGMLDNLQEDYVRTARAKGIGQAGVVTRHIIKNMLIPVVTVLGLQFGSLLAGTVIVEIVFSWPGVGQLTVDGIMRRDYPVVAAAVFFISLMFVLVNLAVDVAYAYLDPRIRYR
jgi:ABC-type dipeptide/oligopeptide/nickel transport system permease component